MWEEGICIYGTPRVPNNYQFYFYASKTKVELLFFNKSILKTIVLNH